MDSLSHLIYLATDKPLITTRDDLVTNLEVSVKYDAVCVIDDLRARLASTIFLDTESALRVYAIAHRFDFSKEMQASARKKFELKSLDSPASHDLYNIPGYAYNRLAVLHTK